MTSRLPSGLSVLCLTAAAFLGPAGAPRPAPAAEPAPKAFHVFVGCYTGKTSKGISLMRLDMADGSLKPVGTVAEVSNPSFLALSPDKKFLYCVNEVGGAKGGGVTGYALDAKTGALTLLNAESTVGSGPCHLVVSPQGRHVLVANYGGGSVAAIPVGPDGKLAPASAFVQHAKPEGGKRGPHAHHIQVDPTGKFVLATDLGLDKLLVYKYDPQAGSLVPNDPPSGSVPPGSGPRHFAFHPNGKFAYVINESLLTVTAFAWDPAKGSLNPLQTIPTTPDGVQKGYSTAEVLVHPSGKFLYGSNRGHDSIAMFRIDESTGLLTSLGTQPTGGKTPRNFAIDPTGTYLLACNQNSDTIVVFKIDPSTGKLTQVGEPVASGSPVCVKFLAVPE